VALRPESLVGRGALEEAIDVPAEAGVKFGLKIGTNCAGGML
jgi:hypothetical protein